MQTGPPREIYLSDPSTPQEQLQTLVEFPIRRSASEEE
jgi:hypothetical protein